MSILKKSQARPLLNKVQVALSSHATRALQTADCSPVSPALGTGFKVAPRLLLPWQSPQCTREV